MSKFDALFKKIELFEKLAVYSDRGAFLKAIAQAADPKVKELVKQMESLIRGAGVTDESVLAPFGNANLFGKVDINAINQAAGKALTQMSGLGNADKANQLIRLQQQLRIAGTPADPGANEPPMVLDPDPTKDTIRAYPPIDPEAQDALGEFVMIKGLTFVDPKKMHDGRLGPETRKALDAFKKYVTEKKPGSTISDKDALAMVKMMVDNKAYA
jgi:hypothetical protein